MKAYIISLLTLLSVSLFGLQAQQSQDTSSHPYWIEMMQDPSANFYATQNAFEKYWDGRTQDKGNGYKPFKRWEWFMEQEVNPDGTYPDRNKMERGFRQFEKQYTPNNTAQFGSGNVVQSTNGAWTNLGPIALPNNGTGQPNGMGRLNCVGLHPTDTAIIIVGASNGGIWRTTDHGATWLSNSDTLVSMQVSNIRFDPKDPNIVYAGTGDRDAGNRSQAGVLKSTDAGISWQKANTGMGNVIAGMLAINPFDTDTILAATSRGIYRTTNAASSWTRVSSNTRHYKDIVFMPGNPQIAYATEGGRFYRSSNHGASWTQITSGIASGTRGVIGVTPADSQYVYFLLCQGSVFQGMYRSTDGGLNFSTRSTTPNIMDYSTNGSGNSGQAWYDLDVAVDPDDKDVVYGGGINIFRSTDGGSTWTINADWVGRGVDAIHADQHALEFSDDGKRLYSGNDGGIYYSMKGNNWIDISSGMAISEVYKIGQAKYNSDAVICGYQDNGTAIYYGGNNWITEIGGDGMECIVDPADGQYMYGALYYGSVRRSTNGGSSFGTIARNGSNGINESGAWVTPYILHETDPNTMFIGYRNLWRSSNVRSTPNSSVSWTKISNNLGGTNNSTLRVLEQSDANTDILFMARADRKLFLSTNINDSIPTWTNLTSNLPVNAIITDIECHPFKDSVVYMLQNRKIYKSTDLGQNWTNISGNLPNVTLRTLVYDRFSNEGIYVGGTPGIYYKDSAMTNWVNFATGLPTDVSVTELEIQYDTLIPALSLLRAATYGRGLWSSDLYDDGTKKPIANIIVSQNSECMGNTITMESRSAYMPNSFQWSISPSTYTILSGSLTSKSLEFRLDSASYYDVQLIATNGNGSDTLFKKNFLRALDTSTTANCITTTSNPARYGIGIFKVSLAGANYTSGGYDGQNSNQDYTCRGVIDLHPDSNYSIEVITGNWNDEFVDVFIDYNGDGDFLDTAELVSSMPKVRTNHADTFRTYSQPLFNTYLRMRVVSDFWDINDNPCKALGYGESEDYLVYFNKSSLQLMSDLDTICRFDSVLFQADSLMGRVDSIVWDFGQDVSIMSATGPGPHSVAFQQSGIHQVSVKLNDNPAQTKNIYVGGWPSISLSQNDSVFCEDDELSMLLNDTLASNITQYDWYQNQSSVQAIGDTAIFKNSVSLTDSGNYYVVADYWSCMDTSQTISVEVNARPRSSLISLTDTTQCLNVNEFSLVKTSQINQGSFVSNWSNASQALGSADTLVIDFQQAGNYVIKLFDSTSQSCYDSSFMNLQVLESPEVSFSIDSSQCFRGHSVQLFDSSNYQLQSRVWDLGDGATSSDSSLSHQYAQAGSYQIGLYLELANSCKDSLLRNVSIHQEPKAGFAQNDTVFCLGSNLLELTDTSLLLPGQSRTWNFGDGNSGMDSVQNHSYASPGLYNITLIMESNESCIDTATSSVQILPDPNAQFSVNNTLVATYEFMAADTGLISYLWNFGDGNTDTNFSAVHVYSSNGLYQVSLQVSDSNSCIDSSTTDIQLENVSLFEPNGEKFIIFPNPAGAEVFIRNFSEGRSRLKLFDSQAKLIRIEEIAGDGSTTAIRGLSSGVYFVELQGEQNARKKLIIY